MKKYSTLSAVMMLMNVAVCFAMAQDKPIMAVGQQATDPEIQERLDKNLPRLRSSNREEREAAIHKLHQLAGGSPPRASNKNFNTIQVIGLEGARHSQKSCLRRGWALRGAVACAFAGFRSLSIVSNEGVSR